MTEAGQRSGAEQAASDGIVVLRAGDRTIGRIRLSGRDAVAIDDAVRATVPAEQTVRHPRARIAYRLDRDAAVRRASALAPAGGVVAVPRRAVAATIAAPVVRQAQRNTCESAALQVLLATAGVSADQRAIQARLPRSGTRDPIERPTGRVWGDPELGYVGRPDGGGTAGGFGVYRRPVASVARSYGRRLDDLTASPSQRIYARLLSGRAVMAWIGLSDGPYGEWTSPEGRPVRVNFGEHTIVLTGVRRDGSLELVNPLEGTREVWSRVKFEALWARLDRRALAVARAVPPPG